MNLKSVKDIESLDSVLSGADVSRHMIELVDLIRKENVSSLSGAETINDLIGYLGYREQLDEVASQRVLEWVKEVYDPNNLDLVCCNSCNVANLNCSDAYDYIIDRANNGATGQERTEYLEVANELGIKT